MLTPDKLAERILFRQKKYEFELLLAKPDIPGGQFTRACDERLARQVLSAARAAQRIAFRREVALTLAATAARCRRPAPPPPNSIGTPEVR